MINSDSGTESERDIVSFNNTKTLSSEINSVQGANPRIKTLSTLPQKVHRSTRNQVFIIQLIYALFASRKSELLRGF